MKHLRQCSLSLTKNHTWQWIPTWIPRYCILQNQSAEKSQVAFGKVLSVQCTVTLSNRNLDNQFRQFRKPRRIFYKDYLQEQFECKYYDGSCYNQIFAVRSISNGGRCRWTGTKDSTWKLNRSFGSEGLKLPRVTGKSLYGNEALPSILITPFACFLLSELKHNGVPVIRTVVSKNYLENCKWNFDCPHSCYPFKTACLKNAYVRSRKLGCDNPKPYVRSRFYYFRGCIIDFKLLSLTFVRHRIEF